MFRGPSSQRGGPGLPHAFPRRAAWTLGLVLFLLVPGCVEPLRALVYEPTPPTPEDKPVYTNASANVTTVDPLRPYTKEQVKIAGAGGTLLMADIWRPNGTDKVPVVLVMSPDFILEKDPAGTPIPFLYPGLVLAEFLQRGYAVALVDLRGTRDSGGCFDYGGALEQADAVVVVEHLGTRDWSNGKVGMVGIGYDGFVALEAAAMKPPHLAAVAVGSANTDLYHVFGKGGAKFADGPGTSLFRTVVIPNFPLPDPNNPSPPPPGDPRLARAKDQSCVVTDEAYGNDPTGVYNAWMKERDLRGRATNATAALFLSHGFVDFLNPTDHLDPFFASYGGPKLAVLDQSYVAIPDFGLLVPWFDHHLFDLNNDIDKVYGVVVTQDSLGRWRNESAWPPLDATPRSWTLAPGVLSENATPPATAAATPFPVALPVPGTAPTATWSDDPQESGGALGGHDVGASQGSTPSRLSFRSEPLAGEVHYAGRAIVRLHVTTDRPNAFVVARLYDIRKDGSWVLVNRGVQSVMLRDALDNPEPATPGASYLVTIQLSPDDFVFKAGERIGLVLSGDDKAYILPSPYHATTSVQYGGDAASALVLPTIGARNVTSVSWTALQPSWRGPRAWGDPSP